LTLFTPGALAKGLLAQDRRALSRAMSWVEDGHEGVEALFREIHPRTGTAVRIGLTGPPGAGKSTLVARLAQCLVARGESVGIVAVDPTSPFTGGALLGDRIRMPELATEKQVFMRSMATRGSLGGIAAATHEVIDLLDAAGYGFVLVETVGVGQSELDVARMTDVTLVVLVPESGDAVQAMKAGLMEIGDLFVVNKADRDGADRAAMELDAMNALRDRKGAAPIPVLKTVAVEGTGVAELLAAAEEFVAAARKDGSFERRRMETERWRLVQLAQRGLVQMLAAGEGEDSALRSLAMDVTTKKLSPHEAAHKLMDAAVKRST